MKHILSLLAIALAFTATTAFAAFNYEVITTPYINQYHQGTDWEYYKIRVTEGSGKLYIVDLLNNIYDSNQTDSIQQQGITRYGYYDVNDPNHVLHDKPVEGNAVVIDSYQASQWHNPATRYGYELGTFKAGDEVEVYLSNGTASASSYTPVEGKNTSRYDSGTVDALVMYRNNWNWEAARKAMPIAELTLYESDGSSTQMRFGFYAKASEYDSTFGAPLPGGLPIALASGLVALGFLYIRRRKAVAS